MTISVPICLKCKHRDPDAIGWICTAFDGYIPFAIISGEFNHTEPYPGDHGIQFEPLDGGEDGE